MLQLQIISLYYLHSRVEVLRAFHPLLQLLAQYSSWNTLLATEPFHCNFLLWLGERICKWVLASTYVFLKYRLLPKKSWNWSVVYVGHINHAHKKFAAAQRHSYPVRSFANVLGVCTTIRGQHWIKTVMVEMTTVLKRLITMALQKSNKDGFIYVILSDSLIYKFITKCILKRVLFLILTGLNGLLGCYWKILN